VSEIGSLTLRKENKFRMSEKRVLRRIFGPKREEEEGGWRIQHNEDLQNLYASPNIITAMKSRSLRSVEQVERIIEKINA
jgi:hypothetical protein